METKKCSRCGEIKSLLEFYYRKSIGKYLSWCKVCEKEQVRNWRKTHERKDTPNPEYHKEWHRKKRLEVRKRIIELLGGRCVRCGYNADWRAFQIDHVNGGGSQERRIVCSYKKLLEDIQKEGTGKYQLLCANCNQIKRYENNENRKQQNPKPFY